MVVQSCIAKTSGEERADRRPLLIDSSVVSSCTCVVEQGRETGLWCILKANPSVFSDD